MHKSTVFQSAKLEGCI